MIEIPKTAVAALQAGDKVEAVKITRQIQQTSLKEALDAVDDYLINNSDVNDAFLQIRKDKNKTLSFILRIAVILLLAGIAVNHCGTRSQQKITMNIVNQR